MRSRRIRFSRQGSMIIEAVISILLLGTATVALTRLAGSSKQLNLQSDQRLAATLTAENVLERLRALPDDQVESEADAVAREVAKASGCEVEVVTESFSSQDREGIHLRVNVAPSKTARITLHDWRIKPQSGSETDDKPEPPVETKETDETAGDDEDE